jgi:hypothetical protein
MANHNHLSWKYLTYCWEKRDLYSLEWEEEITLSKNAWIAGRITWPDTPEMMPRNLTVNWIFMTILKIRKMTF